MKIKCPKCGSIFEGPVQFCPSCGAKLAMPEGASAPVQAEAVAPAPQVVYVQAPTPAPAPAPKPEGSMGKAIAMGIIGLIFGLSVLACETIIIWSGAVGINASKGLIVDGSPEAISVAIAALGWAVMIGVFVVSLLGFIFSLVAAKQKKAKGLTITAKVIGILQFVLMFLTFIFSIVAAIIIATNQAALLS